MHDDPPPEANPFILIFVSFVAARFVDDSDVGEEAGDENFPSEFWSQRLGVVALGWINWLDTDSVVFDGARISCIRAVFPAEATLDLLLTDSIGLGICVELVARAGEAAAALLRHPALVVLATHTLPSALAVLVSLTLVRTFFAVDLIATRLCSHCGIRPVGE